MITELLSQFTTLWWQSDTCLPPLGPAYTPRQQKAHEAHLRQFVDTLGAVPKRPLRTPAQRQATEAHLLAAAERFMCAALGLEKRHRDVILSPDYRQLATAFVLAARRFDPAIRDTDVFQASRNAWVMGGLQMLFGQPVRLTPAVFAYSLLYPYSDNYLDDPAVPMETKTVFQEHFARRLAGEDVAPANARERAIYALVGMIEEQYARSRYPQVYESLLGIHHAQGKSLRLLRQEASPYEVDVLGISLEKGGASVLADGYLVAGDLSPAQRAFTFGWGAFLQIMDDLQDVAQDRRAGRLTVFSQTAWRWPLDALTNRTLHFGQRVLARLDDFGAPGTAPLKELMQGSATLLTINAAGQAGRLYTKAYRRELETHAPFCFSVLKKHVKKLERRRGALIRALNALVTPDNLADIPAPTLTLCKNLERT